ncbi:MAG: glmZ(sRNA)-inactivating NTPase [Elusimicrobia bacterium ADurb.Bin231]|nr:MAG: glmZ(sRNA)-inactivating NTPase [Elusimicrobia bacterium ADurb.Bin231]
MKRTEFFIITGISGAGKSQAIKCFEDLGFFCVGNMPLFLVDKFLALSLNSKDARFRKIALVIDIREGVTLADFYGVMSNLPVKPGVIFFDASNETIIRRFSETRRKHPLGRRVSDAVKLERTILTEIKAHADKVIDTTNMTLQELKETIASVLKISQKTEMRLSVISFGYKYGIPPDADIVMDVRFLPNPNYIRYLKKMTGRDGKVDRYLMKFPQTKKFMKAFFGIVDDIIPQYVKEGKSYLTIAIGCTGGRHRSVVIANRLKKFLIKNKFLVIVQHRDIDKERGIL